MASWLSNEGPHIMTRLTRLLPALFCASLLPAQTAEELVRKNILAHGGIEKIKSVQSMRMTGRIQSGSFTAQIGREAKAPDLIRETFTVQGMTEIDAYDGAAGWKISPFEGRKDPELMGEDEVRELVEEADFYGPLVDYEAKGNKIEYLGHDTVDGDDALKLKVTLKNGDIVYYYLDPETFIEIRKETQEFIRGAVQENTYDYGSYKAVNGVMFPFSIATGPKNDPSSWQTITVEKIEVNGPMDKAEFAVPASLQKDSGKK